MSTTFTIDLDVSRALAAQQKIIDKFDDFATKSARVGESLEPLRGTFDVIDKSIGNINKSSLYQMQKQLAMIGVVMKQLEGMKELRFLKISSSDVSGLAQAEEALKRISVAVNSVTSSMKDMPGFKFDVYSVAQYQDKIKSLKASLTELEYLKPKMNVVDYANFERSYKEALAKYKTELANTINGTNANIAESLARLKSIPKDMDLILQGTQKSFASGMQKLSNYDVSVRAAEEAASKIRKAYTNMGSYQMMGFAGKQPFGEIGASLNQSLGGMPFISNQAAKVASSLKEIGDKGQEAGSKLTGLGLVIKRVFEYGMVYRFQNALLSIPGAIWESNVAMERMSATFRGAFGSEATSMLDYVRESANRYGKEITALADSYKKFSVTMDQLNVDNKTTNMIFESTTEALTKAGASSADTENAFRALIQMYSKGTVSAEEFTRQLSQYIPAANSLAAKSLGVTTAEFKKMLASGALIPDEFIPEFAKQMKIFGLGWEQSADTMEANVTRMKNALMELANSKAFQEAANDSLKVATNMTKDLMNVFAGGRLVAKGDLSFMTWMFGSEEKLNAEIEAYNKKVDTLDGRIEHLREKLKNQSANGDYEKSLISESGIDSLGFEKPIAAKSGIASELEAAQNQKWAQQLQTVIADVSNDFTRLKNLAKDGVDVTADLKYDREKIEWAEYHLKAIGMLNGQSILMTLDVDTSAVSNALQLVNRLWGSTNEGKVEIAKKQYDNIERTVKTLQTELDALNSRGSSNLVDRMRIPQLEDALKKANIEATGFKNTVEQLAKTAASKNLSTLQETLAVPVPGKSDIQAKVKAATQKWNNEIEKINYNYDLQGKSKDDPERIQAVEHLTKVRIAAEKEATKVNDSGANSAKRAAIAVDKYTESLDNLLEKEFALANEDPLGVAFANIAEKANTLQHRMEELAIKSGSALKDIPAKIAEFEDKAKNVAVGKELERIFPWMKKDNEVVSIFKLLNEEWDRTAKKAEELGIKGEELRVMLLGAAEAAKQATKEAALLSKTTSADNFGDYFSNASQLESVKNSSGGSGERAAIKEMGDFFIESSRLMQDSRIEMYRRIAEQAKTYGMDSAKAEAFVQAKMEETEVKRLESLQQYGTASEAFAARMAQNYETYKSAETKARESAVAMADSIKSITDSMASGVGQSIGDIIRNIRSGTSSIVDLWDNMISRMLDAFASFVEDLITKEMKKMLGNMFSDMGSGSSASSAVSSIASLRDGGSGSSGSSILGLGKSIGKGIVDVFSSNDGSSQGAIKSLSKAFAVEKSVASASPSGFTQFTSGASQGGALASSVSGATSAASMLSTVGSVLGVVGAVGGIIGGIISLFGEEEKEPTKTASGYNVGYSGGRASSYGVDFYSDGSVTSTGASDPAVQKKIADAFRETAEALSDFAEELGFTVDVLEGFEMPSMNVTDDQLDSYINNGKNMMAFKGLMEAGLRGAFDAVAQDGEVYSGEYERLATSLSTVKGGFEAYGYELSDVAKISQQNIDDLRVKNTEVAEGTAAAMTAMAESMGATEEVLSQITAESTHAAAALAVTDEQLSNILEADYASKLLDAVGGEDAFNSIMGNLTKNIFSTIGAYAENLDYYNEKAGTAINKLGDASVTVDNFWVKFDEAIKKGLTVDEFESWGKASSWVANIQSVEEAMSDWDNNMTKVAQSLDARAQAAAGLDYQASLTQQLAAAEWELYDARQANYDAAIINRIIEVQALELAATKRKHEEDYQKAVLSAQERVANATDDKEAMLAIQRKKNEMEYKEYEKEFTHAPGHDDTLFKELERAYFLEEYNTLKEISDALAEATQNMEDDLAVREARLAGNEDLANGLEMLASQQNELSQAYKDGLSEELIGRLISVQSAEFDQYLASISGGIIKMEQTLSQLKDSLVDQMNDLINKGVEAYSELSSDTKSLASEYYNAAKSIYSSLQNWAIADDGTKTSVEGFEANKALFNAVYDKAMGGDSEALSLMSNLGGTLREAGQNFYGTKEEYEAFYRDLQSKMGEAALLSDTLGDEKTDLAKLYDVQLNLYELLRDELGKDDPNTSLLEQIGFTMGLVKIGVDTGAGYQRTVSEITGNAGGDGGFASIEDAITSSNADLSGLLASLSSSTTEMIGLLTQYLGASREAFLQQRVDLLTVQVDNSKRKEVEIFKNSTMGTYIGYLSGVNLPDQGTLGHEEAMLTNMFRAYLDRPGWKSYYENMISGTIGAAEYGQYWLDAGYGNYNGGVDWTHLYELMKNNTSEYTQQASYRDLYPYMPVLDSLDDFVGGLGLSPTIVSQWEQTADYEEQLREAEAELRDYQNPTTNTLAAADGMATEITDGATLAELLEMVTTLSNTVTELTEEVKNLRAEAQRTSVVEIVALEKLVSKTDKWDVDGLPEVRS